MAGCEARVTAGGDPRATLTLTLTPTLTLSLIPTPAPTPTLIPTPAPTPSLPRPLALTLTLSRRPSRSSPPPTMPPPSVYPAACLATPRLRVRLRHLRCLRVDRAACLMMPRLCRLQRRTPPPTPSLAPSLPPPLTGRARWWLSSLVAPHPLPSLGVPHLHPLTSPPSQLPQQHWQPWAVRGW